MIPVYQTILDNPTNHSGRWTAGNCYQAAIASVLELTLDDVPHFAMQCGPHYEDHGPVWWRAATTWAYEQGLELQWLPIKDYRIPRDADWRLSAIASGPSPRGTFLHTVVVDSIGELLHDPHPSGAGLAGPPIGYEIFRPIPRQP